jgi:probable HAF family extracellular repeat protein
VAPTHDALRAAKPDRAPGREFRVIDLGTIGGTLSRAFGINNRGQVVGHTTVAPNNFDVHPFLWDKGTLIDLGTLGGTLALAEDINSRGQVVGWSTLAPFGQHAFLWEDGRLIDLTSAGADFSTATAINERGQVVGGRFLWEMAA